MATPASLTGKWCRCSRVIPTWAPCARGNETGTRTPLRSKGPGYPEWPPLSPDDIAKRHTVVIVVVGADRPDATSVDRRARPLPEMSSGRTTTRSETGTTRNRQNAGRLQNGPRIFIPRGLSCCARRPSSLTESPQNSNGHKVPSLLGERCGDTLHHVCEGINFSPVFGSPSWRDFARKELGSAPAISGAIGPHWNIHRPGLNNAAQKSAPGRPASQHHCE